MAGDTLAITAVRAFEVTRDNLPESVWFDEDGGCWRAVKTHAGIDDERDWWRWQPLNLIAFGKGKPVGDLYPQTLPIVLKSMEQTAKAKAIQIKDAE